MDDAPPPKMAHRGPWLKKYSSKPQAACVCGTAYRLRRVLCQKHEVWPAGRAEGMQVSAAKCPVDGRAEPGCGMGGGANAGGGSGGNGGGQLPVRRPLPAQSAWRQPPAAGPPGARKPGGQFWPRGRKLCNCARGPPSAADACGCAARGTACTACVLRRIGMPGRS